MKKVQEYFLSQPHQPFFALGITSAIIMMLIFLLSFKGLFTLSLDPLAFHAYSLIFTVFTPFFLGFLLTTFPRFSQRPAIERTLYLTAYTLLFLGILLFVLGAFISIMIATVGGFLIFLAQLYTTHIFYTIYKNSPLTDKHDQFWIMVAWLEGIVANILFIGYFLEILPRTPLMTGTAIYLYLILLALAVGQRMIPFFSHVHIQRNNNLLKTIFILFHLKIFSDFLDIKIGFIFLLLSGAIMIREILRWKLPFREADAILWILHLAIFWLPTALLIGGFSELAALLFERSFAALTIHLLVLGFLTTIMIGFGTRVTLGHSGNQMLIDNYTKVLFYLTQIIVYFRALYAFLGYAMLFDMTATLWIVLFVAWAGKYLPVLLFGKKLSPPTLQR